MKGFIIAVLGFSLVACAAPTSSTGTNTSGGTTPALGTTAISLQFNKVTVEQGHYGVYLWVEKVNGSSTNFVKTLSWYFDWGQSGSDGGKFTVNGTSANHLTQSQTWRTAAGVTANGLGSFDAMTGATINTGLGGSTPLTVVFNGTLDTKSKLNGTVADEYFGKIFTNKLQGWDGKDASAHPVAAGTYRLRLAVSRHWASGSPSPLFTEYMADITVGTVSGTPVSFTVVQPGTTAAGTSSDEVAAGSGGPVLVLANSTATFTAAP